MRKIIIFCLTILVIAFIMGCAQKIEIPKDFDYLYCNSDEDCATTHFKIGDCCKSCDTFVINEEGDRIQEDWRNQECDDSLCPEFICKYPILNPVCENNQCISK